MVRNASERSADASRPLAIIEPSLMIDRGLIRKVELAGLAGLASAADVAADLPSGVRALDRWRNGEHGAMLFWVDAEVDLQGRGDGTRFCT
jgi:hypothetical protein